MTTLLPDKWLEASPETPAKKKLKPIEFVWYVCDYLNEPSIKKASLAPKDFAYVQRVGHNGLWDTYHAWNEGKEENPCIYLGHHNDGVIE